mmetsp:Transcript_15757/g.45023  ORF Transcript_15757/g.45023 Transcript_15757/m.45023 type:complete len:207 (-) Transcript_15757:58-678(-)
MKAGNAALDIKVLVVVNAQLLGGELLQSIRILRLGRPGVLLLQASSLHLGLELLSLRVDAGRRSVKQALDLGNPAGLHHVEGDHRVVVHDDRVVALDESHTTHVSSKVEHVVATRDNLGAVLEQAQVDQDELITEDILRHVFIALPVASDDVVTLALQPLGKMRCDEATSSCDAYLQLGRPVRLEWILGELRRSLVDARNRGRHFC